LFFSFLFSFPSFFINAFEDARAETSTMIRHGFGYRPNALL
jgi:hypothetical protein